MDLRDGIYEMARLGKAAAALLAGKTPAMRRKALFSVAEHIILSREEILAANARDAEAAKEKGLSGAMIDRLVLDGGRFSDMADAIKKVAKLPDPLSRTLSVYRRPDGLVIKKRPVPIGLIAVIYESRPNVTADAAALSVKSGNAVILRGGSEAVFTNRAIASAIGRGLSEAGFPEGTVQLVQTSDREAVKELAGCRDYVDLVIPRGGESLIRAVTEAAKVPVLKHYNGICHTFVDKSAPFGEALSVIRNAKCQRPGTCNALEKVLVHADIAESFIPLLCNAAKEWGVSIYADERAREIAPSLEEATEEDWHREYLSLAFTLGVVPGVEAAIEHINHYGSHHSDAILTKDAKSAKKFTDGVDSAAVYVNASTRFTDGGEFGFGCEMGISTDKLHARGPVAIRELTTYKYVVTGSGHVRKS